MWNNSWGMMSSPSAGTGTSWTMHVQTDDHGDEIETMQDMSTMGSFDIGEEDESVLPTKNDSTQKPKSEKRRTVQRNAINDDYYDSDPAKAAMAHCEIGPDGSTHICQPYKVELLERQLFTNNPGNARRIAIIETLRVRKSKYT